MNSKELRKKFIDYFVRHGHEHVPSSSLIPAQDPTLLFANAGMNQFKDVFLGNEKRSYNKAITIQKCVRAGGKHNDLDNVGFTKRHLTFFEMMGNFSFGNYFKKNAIKYAWECLTKDIGLSPKDLHITVYKDDDESYDIWHKEIGIPKERIHRLDADENFWQMGDTGPCGPCTEIYIDRGPEYGPETVPGGLGDRFLELWNLVFMQYDRQPDGTDKLLKNTGVDTGMGIERIAAVMQGVDSVYETDLFMPIIKHTEKLTGKKYHTADPEIKAAFQVLADHIRSSSLLIADGCAPSNEGRGYVLRKIIRRAALFAQKLTDDNIFPELSNVMVEIMGDVYPDLKTNRQLIYNVLKSEIEKFAANLVRGQTILEKYFEQNKETKVINGKQAFTLYDTYGFPTELIDIIAKEREFTVDHKGFDKHMQKQKEQSGRKITDELAYIDGYDESLSTEFTGYTDQETQSNVTALIKNKKSVQSVKQDDECWVVVKKSPFFIVGGGQVPDKGWLQFGDKKVVHNQVRYINKAIAVKIIAPVDIKIGDTVTSIVHKERRINAMKNHTATHLLQAALIELFGNQIKQSGSLVETDYLRFDFTYHTNLNEDDIKKVEDLVNEKIREDIKVEIHYTTHREAIKLGVLAFFGEKYNPEKVRIVDVPGFSQELCGGTHVSSTGVIGTFKITDVTALAAGHRRIFAVTGPKAIELFQDTFNTVKKLSQEFKVKREEVLETVFSLKEHNKKLQTQLKKVKQDAWRTHIPGWLNEIEMIGNVPFFFKHLEGFATDELKDIVAAMISKKPGFFFVVSSINGRTQFVSMASPEITKHVDIKKFGTWLKDTLGLRGGGSKNIIQGGGGKFDGKWKTAITEWLTLWE